jgi:hypothetical protein
LEDQRVPDVSSIAPGDVPLWVALDVHKLSIVAATLPTAGDGHASETLRIDRDRADHVRHHADHHRSAEVREERPKIRERPERPRLSSRAPGRSAAKINQNVASHV